MVHSNFYNRTLSITRKILIDPSDRFYGCRRDQSQVCLRGCVYIVHISNDDISTVTIVSCYSVGRGEHAGGVLSLVLSMLSNLSFSHSPRVLHSARPGVFPSIN